VCLAVLAVDAHPRYAVVLAANRDEFHARATEAAHWWAPTRGAPILAGRDRVAGGTWLGVDQRGRYAFVTNVREPGRHDPAAPSRGALVPRVLEDTRPIEDAVSAAIGDSARYNGFNLLAGEGLHAAWGSNRVDAIRELGAGVYGVSNAALDTPWPKLVRTRAALGAWAARGDAGIESLFALLADRTPATPDEMPHTGVTAQWERMLSSPFIVAPQYGTRCSTIVLIDHAANVHFVERSFDAHGVASGEVEYRFAAEPLDAAVSAARVP